MKEFILGDCLEEMKRLEANSIDSIVTDPPYGLSFMGKKWDYDVPNVEIWEECLRVLKPGGYLLSFAGTRTQHRMCVNIEDAGFEIRDMISWVYGSGFPKSLNISKQIDKSEGVEREVIGKTQFGSNFQNCGKTGKEQLEYSEGNLDITAPNTPDAIKWDGWGTGLKPAFEPITVARKPLSEKTVAKNVLKWGTGGINIDGCRVEPSQNDRIEYGRSTILPNANNTNSLGKFKESTPYTRPDKGRWPANFIHDGSQLVLDLFPETTICGGTKKTTHKEGMFGIGQPGTVYNKTDGDNHSAARFFYCAKASKKDRDEGLEEFEHNYKERDNGYSSKISDTKLPRKNNHPTVKPTNLMRYLVRLVTPPSGVVLDPFMGSGSTGKASMLEGFNFIGIEMDEDYFNIAKQRIE